MTPDHKTVREALEHSIHAALHEERPNLLSLKEALAALDRIEATQPPQATDAQKAIEEAVAACRDAINNDASWSGEWLDTFHVVFEAALQSPAVPREVVDALCDLRGCCNLPADNQFKQSCMKKADEALALLGVKEG